MKQIRFRVNGGIKYQLNVETHSSAYDSLIRLLHFAVDYKIHHFSLLLAVKVSFTQAFTLQHI